MCVRTKFRLAWRACVAALLLFAAGALQAQTDDTAGDPPDRVARLSWLEGDIGLLPSGAQTWGEAGLNRPLTRGDRLSTSAGARAELELDGATVRLDGGTDLGFLELDDSLAQIELTEGTLNLTVRQLGAGQSYEIDTPTVALVVDHPGSFRVDVDRDGQVTRVTAFDGSATAYGEDDAQRPVLAGRSYRFADPTLDDVALEAIGAGDDFDAWCDERARRYVDTESSRYVSEDVIGYQDLDRYGEWQADSEYGTVWYPAHVDADWAPYRNGHWAWVGPWGWTWIDDAPWGFAPYHYGRWAWRHQRWGWVPGPRTGWRPVYAPALVAFVGGRHWNVSVGTGAAPVGWFPLGPGEVYNPWYHGSRGYYARINGGHRHGHHDRDADRIDRHYRDWRRGIAPPVRALRGDRTRGFTAVAAHDFANADRVQRHRLHIDARELADARVLSRAAAPRPTPHSLAPRRPPQARPLPVHGFRRDVVARHAPRALDRTGPASHAQPHHVRVLGRHAGTLPTVARLAPAPSGRTHPVEAVRGAAGRTVRSAREPTRDVRPTAAPRRGELRSAHFARSHRLNTVSHETARPRSRVSFISSAEADRARVARTAPRLPQVPRLERADGRQAPAARRPHSGTHVQRPRTADMRTHAGRIEATRWQRPMAREAATFHTRPGPPAHPRPPHRDPGARAVAAPRFHRPADARPARPVQHRAAAAGQTRSSAAAHGRSPAPHRFDPRH